MSLAVNCVMPETKSLNLKKGGERYLNLTKTRAKDAIVSATGIGASIVAATAVRNSSVMQEGLKKAGEFIKRSKAGEVIADAAKELKPYLQKAAEWVKALPGPAKAVLAIGVLATALISKAIRNKGLRNDGKIEQKYADKAALQNTLA